MIGVEEFEEPNGTIDCMQVKVVGCKDIEDVGADEGVEVEAMGEGESSVQGCGLDVLRIDVDACNRH